MVNALVNVDFHSVMVALALSTKVVSTEWNEHEVPSYTCALEMLYVFYNYFIDACILKRKLEQNWSITFNVTFLGEKDYLQANIKTPVDFSYMFILAWDYFI